MTEVVAEKLLTAKEAAKYMRVHLVTVYIWVRAGKLTASRAGKAYRFKQSDLDAFMGIRDATPAASTV